MFSHLIQTFDALIDDDFVGGLDLGRDAGVCHFVGGDEVTFEIDFALPAWSHESTAKINDLNALNSLRYLHRYMIELKMGSNVREESN